MQRRLSSRSNKRFAPPASRRHQSETNVWPRRTLEKSVLKRKRPFAPTALMSREYLKRGRVRFRRVCTVLSVRNALFLPARFRHKIAAVSIAFRNRLAHAGGFPRLAGAMPTLAVPGSEFSRIRRSQTGVYSGG